MNKKQATSLKIGDRVLIWPDNTYACSGTIIEKNWMAAKIKWDDGEIGVIHLDDFANVTLHNGPIIIPILRS